MTVRNIIRIDEEKCNGCGKCVNACPEGALQMIDGKARLVREDYCDGLGACIGDCPTGALVIEQREADEFDEAAVEQNMAAHKAQQTAGVPSGGGCPISAAFDQLAPSPAPSGGCPGSAQKRFAPNKREGEVEEGPDQPSELTHWPIQLHLARTSAPQFQGADVLIAADCTAFSFGTFHRDLLAGRSLLIACPKLDNKQGYLEKLIEMFSEAKPRSVTIARMQVPCCSGLVQLVRNAREAADAETPVREIVIGVEGGVLKDEMI